MSLESPLTTEEIVNRRLEIDTHGSPDPFKEHDALDNVIETKEASSGEITTTILKELGTRPVAEVIKSPILGTEDQALADSWKVTQK